MHKNIKKIVSITLLTALLSSNYVYTSTFAEDTNPILPVIPSVNLIPDVPVILEAPVEPKIIFEAPVFPQVKDEGSDENGSDEKACDKDVVHSDGNNEEEYDREHHHREHHHRDEEDKNDTGTGSGTGTGNIDTGTGNIDTGTGNTDTGTGSNTGTGSDTGTGSTNTGNGSVTGPVVPKLYIIEGSVYDDADKSGWWASTETGLKGWIVTLNSNDGKGLSFSGVADEKGYYKFTGIPTGSFTLCEILQTGWIQTYPNLVGGCYDVTLVSDLTPYHFGNYNTGTGIVDTNTGSTNTGTTNTGSTSTGTTNTGSTSTGTTDTNTGLTNTPELNTFKVEKGSGGGGSRILKKLLSFDVDSTIESSGIPIDTKDNIAKIYNEYLLKLNRLSVISKSGDSKLEQEKISIENYKYGNSISQKHKSKLDKIIKKLSKLDLVKRQELILKLFSKLDEAEQKFSDKSNLLNLISYLKLKLSISYSV